MVSQGQGSPTPAEVIRWAIDKGRVVLILDALDQVPEASRRLTGLADFLESHDGQQCRVILTSRFFEVPRWREHLFNDATWRFARIEGFDEEQQGTYLEGLYEDSVDELIPNRAEVADLLRLPVVLHMIRESATPGKPLQFTHRRDLYLKATRRMIERGIEKAPQENKAFYPRDVPVLERILAAAAFEMMHREVYEYAVWGPDQVDRFRGYTETRCPHAFTRDRWDMVWVATDLTERFILEVCNEQVLGWRHRGMMEFYCGLYLAKYARDECVALARRFTNDEQWVWAWRFAIELPADVIEPDALCRSLRALYQRPDNGTRPTELMYRAWEVLETVPGGSAVLKEFQDQFTPLTERDDEDGETARQLLPDGKRKRPRDDGKENADKAERNENNENADDEYIDNFQKCQAGAFEMGAADDDEMASEDERPWHRVRITKAFWLQSTPVTRAQYGLFDPNHVKAQENNFAKYAPKRDCPVVYVDWYDAWVFARWIAGRLPTEAEWEYACRAGTTTRYCFGDDPANLGQYAWYGENSQGQTHPVATREHNGWHLFDMHGNVWEWCEDWHDDYAASPVDDPTGPAGGSNRVIRGGCWYDDASLCRAALRDWCEPSNRDDYLGFRLARAVSSPSR